MAMTRIMAKILTQKTETSHKNWEEYDACKTTREPITETKCYFCLVLRLVLFHEIS